MTVRLRWTLSLITTIALSCGCAHYAARGAPPGQIATVTIHFGTDRVPVEQDGKVTDYRPATAIDPEVLRMGECVVSVPPMHERGKVERPSLWKLEFHENPEKHFVLQSITPTTAEAFKVSINAEDGDAVMFIHGFNVSFRGATYSAAQIGYDLQQIPYLYAWSSQGTKKGYFADETAVERTLPLFREYLKFVLARTSAAKLHLVAHSMGSRAVTKVLNQLAEEGADLTRVGQVVLLAADLDAKTFETDIYPRLKRAGRNVANYASRQDEALNISAAIHGNFPRLGQAGDRLTVLDGMTTIDASECNHGCFLCHSLPGLPCVVDDLYLALTRHSAPEDRLLKQQEQNGVPYWVLFERH